MLASSSVPSFQSTCNIAIVAAAIATTFGLSGCADKAKSETQVVAKVNNEELSIHQINHLLQRQQTLKPEQVEPVSRQILERLIDQELAVQKAKEMKVDREPEVIQAIEAARREIISRTYLDRVSNAASRPTSADVKKYFDEMPALFKERRVYEFQEISVEAKPEQLNTLSTELKNAKNVAEFTKYLRANEMRFSSNAAIRPAEQIPLSMLDTFAKMKDGDAILTPALHGAHVVFVIGSQSSPFDEAKARPAIEQFLLNERKRHVVEKDIKWLRETGKVEYLGKFAASPTSAPATAALPTAATTRASGADADVAK
jgi:EpsD family peptidyl-prolyl cis-trans isomerase